MRSWAWAAIGFCSASVLWMFLVAYLVDRITQIRRQLQTTLDALADSDQMVRSTMALSKRMALTAIGFRPTPPSHTEPMWIVTREGRA